MYYIFAAALILLVATIIFTVIKIKPWDNIKTTEYIYIINKPLKAIIELERETGIKYCKAMNISYCEEFNYEDYGYDNPYDFISDWTFYDVDMNIIKYDYDEKLYEVLYK